MPVVKWSKAEWLALVRTSEDTVARGLATCGVSSRCIENSRRLISASRMSLGEISDLNSPQIGRSAGRAAG